MLVPTGAAARLPAMAGCMEISALVGASAEAGGIGSVMLVSFPGRCLELLMFLFCAAERKLTATVS